VIFQGSKSPVRGSPSIPAALVHDARCVAAMTQRRFARIAVQAEIEESGAQRVPEAMETEPRLDQGLGLKPFDEPPQVRLQAVTRVRWPLLFTTI